jgi:hypothetical protein
VGRLAADLGLSLRAKFGHNEYCSADVAQWLERLSVAQEVVGSIPIIRPKFYGVVVVCSALNVGFVFPFLR